MKKTFTLVGIGELLWDIFPDHKRLGGAPANFACHCRQLGLDAYPVSCIGNDDLGQEIMAVIKDLAVPNKYLQVNPACATGTVQVTLDQNHKPSYLITKDVAWDNITFTDDLKALAQKTDAVCFGSLAQRSQSSRETIQAFLQAMPPHSIKIFDINLRQDYFNKDLITKSLKLANILKLSDEELDLLAEYFSLKGDLETQLKQLRQLFDLKLIAYTRGSKGSLLLAEKESDDTAGLIVKAIDSVGAGDSFTAAMCTGLLRQWPLSKVNKFANQVAAFVCSQNGATPELPEEIKIINN